MDRPRLIRVLVTASTTRVDRISYIGAVVVADSSGNAIMAWRAADDVAIRCFDASTRMWSARVEIDTDAPGQLEVSVISASPTTWPLVRERPPSSLSFSERSAAAPADTSTAT